MKKGWSELTLGELCRFEQGTSPTLKTEPGEYPLVVTAAYRRSSAEFQFDEPAVCIPLVSSTGHGNAALHRVHYQDGKFALANLLVAVIPKPGGPLDAKFLWRYLSALKDRKLVPLMQGTANVSLKEKDLVGVSIPLPPLAEQRRVVTHLDAIESHLTRAQKLRKEAEGELAALFPKLLAEAMTPHGDGWKRETIKDVIESMDAGWSPQCHDFPAGIGQWGVLKTTSVQWGDFQRQHNKALPSTYVPVPSLAVREGDVLVTRAGPRKRVGVVAAVKSSEPWLTISDKLIRLRVDRAKIQPRFLELSLASPFSQEHLVQRKTGLADAQVNISQAILRATPIAYPPIQEQEKIIAELDAARGSTDALSCHQKVVGAELDALLPSLLDHIFHS